MAVRDPSGALAYRHIRAYPGSFPRDGAPTASRSLRGFRGLWAAIDPSHYHLEAALPYDRGG